MRVASRRDRAGPRSGRSCSRPVTVQPDVAQRAGAALVRLHPARGGRPPDWSPQRSPRGSRARARTAAFSWRQPALALVTALALLSPVVWGVTWLTRGAADPIDRGTANPLPAFVRAQSELPEQIRTLVLQPVDGRLAYTAAAQPRRPVG